MQAAVERELINIGEALCKLRRLGISLSITDQLINRRNTLTHQYDVFSAASIWNSVHVELHDLKSEVEELLAK
ncbi:MAG: HepT-like ribonuclease domain-containing protein [Bacteroidota bacterium]